MARNYKRPRHRPFKTSRMIPDTCSDLIFNILYKDNRTPGLPGHLIPPYLVFYLRHSRLHCFTARQTTTALLLFFAVLVLFHSTGNIDFLLSQTHDKRKAYHLFLFFELPTGQLTIISLMQLPHRYSCCLFVFLLNVNVAVDWKSSFQNSYLFKQCETKWLTKWSRKTSTQKNEWKVKATPTTITEMNNANKHFQWYILQQSENLNHFNFAPKIVIQNPLK